MRERIDGWEREMQVGEVGGRSQCTEVSISRREDMVNEDVVVN